MALRHVIRRGGGVMSSLVKQAGRGGAGPSLKESKVNMLLYRVAETSKVSW